MKKDIVIKIFELLKKEYPNAKCSLNFNSPFEILVAVALSAQCTDERVNKVTAEIFPTYNTPEDFANLPIENIEKMIHSCGFYRNKAKNLKLASQKIINDFNGNVPCTMEELMSIPGIGRKSANVIMLEAFNNPQGIAVDTHVARVSKRLELTKSIDVLEIERDLMKFFPENKWSRVHHQLVLFGRYTCKSKNPLCDKCPFKCKYMRKY